MQNIKGGMELVETALEYRPENYEFIDTKGWALYKQGKYHEALNILQKSWDLRRAQAVYDHEALNSLLIPAITEHPEKNFNIMDVPVPVDIFRVGAPNIMSGSLLFTKSNS